MVDCSVQTLGVIKMDNLPKCKIGSIDISCLEIPGAKGEGMMGPHSLRGQSSSFRPSGEDSGISQHCPSIVRGQQCLRREDLLGLHPTHTTWRPPFYDPERTSARCAGWSPGLLWDSGVVRKSQPATASGGHTATSGSLECLTELEKTPFLQLQFYFSKRVQVRRVKGERETHRE